MAGFVRGEVVVVPWPFSSGLDSKRRPAVIVSPVPYGHETDYLLCLMTATADKGEKNLFPVSETDFEEGATYQKSGYIRPTVLFTMDGRQLVLSLGRLKQEKIDEIMAPIRALVA